MFQYKFVICGLNAKYNLCWCFGVIFFRKLISSDKKSDLELKPSVTLVLSREYFKNTSVNEKA